MSAALDTQGYLHLPYDPKVAAWAAAAHDRAVKVAQTPGDLRHGKTWRVGVDELPNAPDGSIGGVPLTGSFTQYITPPTRWHQGQLSIIYPGYPRQDPGESDANHLFRLNRDAAHVDGLLPIGSTKRRHLIEPHAFILGLPLNSATGSPLVVWPGSHKIMQQAFQRALTDIDPTTFDQIDLTDIYIAARKEVFASCTRRELPAIPGEVTLLHRHLVHGVAPWGQGNAPSEGRMIAYFRPLTSPSKWLQ